MELGPLDLFSDQDLIDELSRRQCEKELAYLMYLGIDDVDDGEVWLYSSNVTYDALREIYDMEMEEFEENGLYNADNWTPRSDEEMEEWEDD